MSKEKKDPFEGVSDEELQALKAEFDAEIAVMTEKRNAAIVELGRRANPGKPASLADCVNMMKKTAANSAKVRLEVETAAKKAADKAIADAGKKPAGKKTAA